MKKLHEYLSAVSESGRVRAGTPLPLGAQIHGNGVNFALFARHATAVRLELYDQPDDGIPSLAVDLNPLHHRTGDIWHVWIGGVSLGQCYGYRVDGPYQPMLGLRFNRHKLLLDPYAKAITRKDDWEFDDALGYNPDSPVLDLSFSEQDNAALMPKCVCIPEYFDWGQDSPPRHPWSKTLIYETHVRGLTIHPSSGVQHPGTYRGLIEKLPFLQALGITAVELMPVQEFNQNELKRCNPLTGERLKNYWGYNPVAFSAPKASYASAGGQGHQLLEFKEMVKACHRAGIEVILDVVFNHTAEGNELGPTLSWRGIDNPVYYLLADNKRRYLDFSGTGNSIYANHPVVRDMILDSLRYWVLELHVDGFRFDLASVLARDRWGNLLPDPPLLERIAEDPILRQVKLIAEAWDAAGAYQVGQFSERRWAEWNGRYRDEVRRFWRGDDGMLGLFASRICGSSDLYQHSGKGPEASINYITCHDGFTLNDLVSYAYKHNEANGEANRDGMDENFSANYGVEGPTDDPFIEQLRQRQIKNFLLTLFISRGVPMLLGGDEFRRSQRGNNNAYCQDNEISWYDWRLLHRHRQIHRFTQGMIALRKAHPVLSKEAFYRSQDILWFNPKGKPPDWWDPRAKQLGCLIYGEGEGDLCLLFNAGDAEVSFMLPPPPTGRWHRVADTALLPPADICASGKAVPISPQDRYCVLGHSSVILLAL